MAETCKGCYHWRGEKDCEYCHYLLDTGFPRNCPADNCLFYKKEFFKMGKGHKIPESIRLRVLEAVNAGIGYSDIARSFKIGQTSVRRIAYAAQKISPETVSTPIEPVLEDITHSGSPAGTNIIPDVPENVKQDEYSPYNPAVDDAVLERIERLRTKIEELNHDIVCYEKEISAMMQYHEKCMEAQNNERSNENC